MDYRMIGALIGFLLGAAGYVVVKYWIKPIRKYRRLKSRILENLTTFEKRLAVDENRRLPKKLLKELRRASDELCDCYTVDIPVWYRLKLQSRGESPVDAAGHIQSMSGAAEKAHALQRLVKTRTALGVTPLSEAKS